MNAAIYSKNIKLYSLIFYMDQVHPRIHSCCHRWILQEPVHRIKALNPYGKVWFSVKRSVKIDGCWNEATTSSIHPAKTSTGVAYASLSNIYRSDIATINRIRSLSQICCGNTHSTTWLPYFPCHSNTTIHSTSLAMKHTNKLWFGAIATTLVVESVTCCPRILIP